MMLVSTSVDFMVPELKLIPHCRALQHVVEKCGSGFEPHLTSELLELVFTSLSHTNRFVRETGYKVIAAIITIHGQCLQ